MDCQAPGRRLTGNHANYWRANMTTLPDIFRRYSITQLLDFADSLDPNNGWRESLADDPTITRDDLAAAMLAAYDDIDTHNWINK